MWWEGREEWEAQLGHGCHLLLPYLQATLQGCLSTTTKAGQPRRSPPVLLEVLSDGTRTS